MAIVDLIVALIVLYLGFTLFNWISGHLKGTSKEPLSGELGELEKEVRQVVEDRNKAAEAVQKTKAKTEETLAKLENIHEKL